MTATVHANETLVAGVLVQLIAMIVAARAGHTLFRALGQPGVVGEIVAGLALGPSLLGHLFPAVSAALFGTRPSDAIIVISQIGLILLMFQIGSEFEFGRLAEGIAGRATIAVAATSLLAPLALGIGFGAWSSASLAPGIDPVSYALFCGVALAITAVPILGRILREFGLTRTPLGLVAISAAAANDVVGWLLLAFVSAYATAAFSGGLVMLKLGELAALGLAARVVLWPLAERLVPADDAAEPLPANLLAIVLCLMFSLALATARIGVFAIFGGFLAGLLFHRHRAFAAAWHERVGRFVLVFFLPVFFTFTGLRTNLLGLTSADLGWLAVVLAVAVAGKVAPVAIAAQWSGFTGWEALTLGALMNTRALMELIVLNIGYDLGVLPKPVFSMLVVMAVVTTMMTGPLLRLLLPRIGHRAAARIEA